jgi:hypothetical protein
VASRTEAYPELDAEMDLGQASTDVQDIEPDRDHDPAADDLSLAMSDVSMTMSVLLSPTSAAPPPGAPFSFESERSADDHHPPSIDNATVVFATFSDDDDDDDDDGDDDGDDGGGDGDAGDGDDGLQPMCALRPPCFFFVCHRRTLWFVSRLHSLLSLHKNASSL